MRFTTYDDLDAVWTVDGEPPYTDGEIDLDVIGREDMDEEN